MSECDIWEACANYGYGCIMIGGKSMRAHRVVWMQTFGHTDLYIMHSCDTPSCINIEHLSAGTQQDNMDDKVSKGRYWSKNMGKTECKRGHPFDEVNTKIRSNGYRRCLKCSKEESRKYRTRQKVSL